MATYSKEKLSEQFAAIGTLVSSSSSASPITIHETPSADIDEVWIYASNSGSVSSTLVIKFSDLFENFTSEIHTPIPSKSGLTLVVPGLLLKAQGCKVLAYASVANVITISGYVNRIS